MGGERASKIREHWESPTTVSLADHYLKELEISAIEEHVPPGSHVLDIGCGDGEGTIRYARRAESVLGIDYSAQMIARAQELQEGSAARNVSFRHENLLTFEPDSPFDCIVTERCLINLDDWPTQEQALERMRDMLRPGGLYLMSEATIQGLEALNEYRRRVSLAPISMPWHNRYFDSALLMPRLESLGFTVRGRVDFGLYNFVSRVINPLSVAPAEPQRDSPVNRAGFELQRALGNHSFDGVGAISLLVLERGT
jgi:ubiquinone/menaquinone biosynthesis C-methylase UbiE